MNTSLFLCVFALLSVALCNVQDTVADTFRPVIDLHEIVTGFNVPEPPQTQRYWLDSRTIVIDLNAFYDGAANDGFFPPDHLWEFNLHADHAIGGINSCEYSLGFLSLDADLEALINNADFDTEIDTTMRLDQLADILPRHVIKTGGFGEHRLGYGPQNDPWTFEKQNEGSFWQRSSSVVFLRGADPKLDRRAATHIYLHVDSCYLSRYLIQSQFEKWSGGSYLMDWGSTPLEQQWYRSQVSVDSTSPNSNRLVRWEAFNVGALSNEPTFINKFNFLDRDSTIFGDSQGWWHEHFYFDYSRFMTGANVVARPVLDFWYYSGEDDIDQELDWSETTYFAMCSASPANVIQCDTEAISSFDQGANDRGAAIFSSSTSGQSVFVRSYMDIRGLETFLYGNNPPPIQTLLVHGGVKAAIPPYARMWDANTARAAADVGPGLMSIQNPQNSGCTHGGITNLVDLPGTPRATTYFLLGAWNIYRCSATGTGQASIDFSIPAFVTSWPNPWMQWLEWGEDTNSGEEYAYRIIDGNVANIGNSNKVLHVSSYDHDPNPNSQQPMEFQVPLPQPVPRLPEWTVVRGQSLHVDITNGRADVSAWVPIYPGVENKCIDNPCDNLGDSKAVCYNWYRNPTGFQCMCSKGWMGDTCGVTVDDCYVGACLNGGLCVDVAGADPTQHLNTFVCNCDATEYSGEFCEKLNNNCPVGSSTKVESAAGAADGVCLNSGTCISDQHGWHCVCDGTWSGDFCETSTDDCRMDPIRGANACGMHGTCTDTSGADGKYTCDCEIGWEVDPWCQVHNVCYGANSPCMNGGMCVAVESAPNGPMVASCMCAGSWFGETCSERFDQFRNDCRPNRSGNTCQKGECKPVPGGNAGEPWACDCPDGYQGHWCEMATQCVGAANPCMTMDAAAECRWMPTNPAAPTGGAIDQRGLFGEHMCICSSDWFGPLCNERLEDYFDDCRFWPTPCNGGACLPRTSGLVTVYECDCTAIPFDGEFCENPLACRGAPCGENGECSVEMGVDGTYARHCHCFGGYVGETCEFALTDWINQRFNEYTTDCRFSDLVCLNGGQCIAGNDSFICDCQGPYTGPTCAVANVCEPNPCEAGGICDIYDSKAVCLCPGGRAGDRCEQGIREFFKYDCRLSGCMNGGTCSASTLTCNCPAEYLPPTCEKPAVCAVNPCLNGGMCQLGDGPNASRFCLCPGDYFGPNCEWDVSLELADCRTQSCGDRGECDLFNGDYICICQPGWEGDLCEISPHCNPQPCKNGGLCYEYAQSFACHCSGDWSGSDCAISISARLEEVEERLEADVAGQVSNQVSSTVNDDITVLQSEFGESENAIDQLNEELKALRQQLNAVGTSSKTSQDAVDELRDGFCTIEEVDKLRTQLELFLAPANNIVMSLGLLLSIAVYFLN